MHRRQISFSQPEPGEKVSNTNPGKGKIFRKYLPHMAALSVVAGLAGTGVSYALRMKALNDEIARKNQNIRELNKKMTRSRTHDYSAYASNTHIDDFLESARVGVVKGLKEEIAVSDALILNMESDIAGYSFVRDGAFTMVAFIASMIIGVSGTVILKKREERNKALDQKPQEQPRERRIARAMEDIGHAETCIPAPVAPPKEAEAPKEKFPRPKYYEAVFEDLKKSIKEEMGPLGSEEAAEAFLCIMKHSEIDELINWPETIAVHIEKNRDHIKEFLQEKKVDPRHLFARLGREVTDLF